MTTITPYIAPVEGTPYKLPPTEKIYRLYECDNIFINAKVGKNSEEMKSKILDFYKKIGGQENDSREIIINTFNYQKIFISSEGHKIIIDLVKNKIIITEEDKLYFKLYIEQKKEMEHILKLGDYLEFGISCSNKKYGNLHITIDLYKNPQINNSIKFLSPLHNNSIGLLIRNYKPEEMIIDCIDRQSVQHIDTHLKPIITNKKMFNKNDIYELFIKKK